MISRAFIDCCCHLITKKGMFSIDDINTVITNNGKTIKVDLTNSTKVGHTHKIVDVSDLEEQLTNKATTNHTHSISEVKDLRTELDGKSDMSYP